MADGGDGGGVGWAKGEAGEDRMGTLQEESHGGNLGKRLGGWQWGESGQREGIDRELLLTPEMEGGTTGDQHSELFAGREQIPDDSGGASDMLEVVEHQEQMPCSKVRAEGFFQSLLTGFA